MIKAPVAFPHILLYNSKKFYQLGNCDLKSGSYINCFFEPRKILIGLTRASKGHVPMENLENL